MAFTQATQSASDTDVLDIAPEKVTIHENKIIITGKARIRMRVFSPESSNPGSTSQFMGQPASWVEMLAHDATFTVLRPEQGKSEWWETMTMNAAKDLQNGELIGRIGFYRPDVTLKMNAVNSVNGFGYIYPKTVSTKKETEE